MRSPLGQNFLTSKDIAGDVAQNANLSAGDTVLEIGPGKGILTEELLKTGAKIIAVEKDTNLLKKLEEKYQKEILAGSLKFVVGDITEISLKDLGLKNGKYTVASNIPYYITGQILEKFLSSDIQTERMVLMVQREVADRITGRTDGESILSMSIKAYGEPKFVRPVKAGSFSPKPKVDSAIIKIENISKNNFKDLSEEKFFKILKRGYGERRKTLWNNLKKDFDEKNLEELLKKCAIDPKERAERIPLEKWLYLAKNLIDN